MKLTAMTQVMPTAIRRLDAECYCIQMEHAWSPAHDSTGATDALHDAVAADYKAGVARVAITPTHPMWMSGYASRSKPGVDKVHDLWAKALAIEDGKGHRAVLVTLDLVGIDRDTSLAIRNDLKAKHNLALSQIALCTSHTHTGPVVGDNLMSMYFLTPPHRKAVADYTGQLKRDVVRIVGEAIKDMRPARLSYGVGEATFAVNRRNNRESDVPRLRAEGQLRGPVDHSVPVLRVTTGDDQLRAIVFGYACHATTLAFYQWSGDYLGYAQIALEERHPGATAMFVAGCGADINPLPRRRLELAQDYGRQLADAVDKVLADAMQPVAGELTTRYTEIDLQFDTQPTEETMRGQAE